MKRLYLCFFALLFSITTTAQQPDVRLQLLSLYSLKEVNISPIKNARVRLCASCEWKPLTVRVKIAATGSALQYDGQQQRPQAIWISGDVNLAAEGPTPREIKYPLEIRAQAGHLSVIVAVPLEDYVAGVVQGETAGDMPADALRAIAVAARTYTTRFRERHKPEHFDFCDTTHCQFVRAEISPHVAAAVAATRGEILWANGSPVAAYYHKDCGGRTENSASVWPEAKQAANSSHEDPYCLRVSKSWRAEISRSDVNTALRNAQLRVPRDWSQLRIAKRTQSGRAQTLIFSEGNSASGIPVAASAFRFAIGRTFGWNLLKSDLYEVKMSGAHFVFAGRGMGHGVGLCQLGAGEMARQGKNYREILAFYYPGATVGISASGITWHTVATAPVAIEVVTGKATTVASAAPKALAWAEAQTGLRATGHPKISVYPSVQMFRDATGEPGWVAASTRGDQVRMQPAEIIGARVEDVLKHEFVHMLLEHNSAQNVPMWYREGMAMLITGEAKASPASMPVEQMEQVLRKRSDQRAMQSAYASAGAIMIRLQQRYGRAELLRWLRDGLPAGVANGDLTQTGSYHR